MIHLIVIIGYLLAVGVTLFAAKGINFQRLSFIDGCLIGAIFFVICPMTIVLVAGVLPNPGVRRPAYYPYEDLLTTANIFIGLLVVSSAALFSRSVGASALRAERKPFERQDLWIFISIYLFATAFTFFVSGKHQGGHWYKNMSEGFSTRTDLVAIANFANVYRAAAFGALLYLIEHRKLKLRNGVIIGVVLALIDISATFNRITLAYLAIFAFIALRKRIIPIVFAGAFVAPLIAKVTAFWAMFRGLAIRDGYNLSSMAKAFTITQQHSTTFDQGFGSTLNGVFEASNILVFNAIVKSVPEHFEPLWGQTFLVRPLAIFVPGTIWKDKPRVFGTLLGERFEGVPGLALNSTLFGEVYANFYYLWPIVLIISLVILDTIYRKFANVSRVYGYCGLFVGFAIWRFDFAFTTISLLGLVTFELVRNVGRNAIPFVISRRQSRISLVRPSGGRR